MSFKSAIGARGRIGGERERERFCFCCFVSARNNNEKKTKKRLISMLPFFFSPSFSKLSQQHHTRRRHGHDGPAPGRPRGHAGRADRQARRAEIRDPELTTFVCVCIPEFLSLYETERLVQELAKFEIDCRNVVVNQVISPSEVGSSRLLAARVRMQAGYLAQFDELYEDFHLVKMPLLDEEVRGVDALRAFSRFLVDPAAAEEAGRRGTLLPEKDGGGAKGDGSGSASPSSSSNPLEAEVSRLRKRVAELEKELADAKK